MYFFAVGMPHNCEGLFPRKEGRIQALAGLAPSCQTVGSLGRTPWPDSLTRKNCQKVCLAECTSVEKCTQLLFDQIHLAKSKT